MKKNGQLQDKGELSFSSSIMLHNKDRIYECVYNLDENAQFHQTQVLPKIVKNNFKLINHRSNQSESQSVNQSQKALKV